LPSAADNGAAAVVSRGSIGGDLLTPSCHASPIAETKPGEFVAAWFGAQPKATKTSGSGCRAWSVGRGRLPLRSLPVRSLTARLLFYKVGPSPVDWSGLVPP